MACAPPGRRDATPVSYESGGRQYIVVVAGSHHMFDRRPAGGAVVAFALPR